MKKRNRYECRLHAPSTPFLEMFVLRNKVSSTPACKHCNLIPKVKTRNSEIIETQK